MNEYISGYPAERGLFYCKVNGRDQVLVHHYCGTNRRHWWSDTTGHDVLGEILYNPIPYAVRKKDL